LKEYNGNKVWYIDNLPTLIDSVHGDYYAKGRLVNGDLTLTSCYIARSGNSLAHGETLRKAAEDAQAKAMEQMPLEERLDRFKAEFPSLDSKEKCEVFYHWHHILTGSCTMGRDQFVRDHGLNMDKEYTVGYFLDIVKDAYGSGVIRKLREMYS